MFTVSVVGSVLFAFTTVAEAWVLRWATDQVIRPSFERRRASTRALWPRRLAVHGGRDRSRALGDHRPPPGRRDRVLPAGRRTAAGSPGSTCALPMAWHQQHPTGQLLSNANADVEATWADHAAADGGRRHRHAVVAVVAMLFADVVLAARRAGRLPAPSRLNVVYQRWLSPRVARAQQLRGDVSAVAHESFDGALVVKSLGREADETGRFARQAPGAARRQHRGRPHPQRSSTRCSRRCPTSACSP